MRSFSFAVRPGACKFLVLVALLAIVADADARGGRRGGGSRTSSSSSSSHKDTDSSGPTINIRPRASSTSSSPQSAAVPMPGGRMQPGAPNASDAPVLTPEEAAKRAAMVEAYEREQAEKLAAHKAAAEKAEAERVAAEKAANEQKASEERAQAAKIAAAQQRKQSEAAAVAADVDRVLQRAMDDYPVLRTPQGEPVLRQIMARQKEIISTRGLYPSVALVEAVADHAHLLAPATPAVPAPATTPAAVAVTPAATEQTAAANGCRWVTPIQWACD